MSTNLHCDVAKLAQLLKKRHFTKDCITKKADVLTSNTDYQQIRPSSTCCLYKYYIRSRRVEWPKKTVSRDSRDNKKRGDANAIGTPLKNGIEKFTLLTPFVRLRYIYPSKDG